MYGKTMCKILSFSLVILIAFGLSACGGSGASGRDPATTIAPDDPTSPLSPSVSPSSEEMAESTSEGFQVKDGVILGYEGDIPESLEIPSEVNGERVTAIGEQAFRSKKINELVISEGIERIGVGAFMWCRLSAVELPATLKAIDPFAFACNQLTAVELPESLEEIGGGAFNLNYFSSDMAFITDPLRPEVLVSYARSSFLTPEVTIPESITVLGANAFNGTEVRNFIYHDGITEIGAGCFMGCGDILESFILPNVSYIPERVLAATPAKSIVVPATVESIHEKAFEEIRRPEEILIYKPKDSIPGAPWGAEGITIKWIG